MTHMRSSRDGNLFLERCRSLLGLPDLQQRSDSFWRCGSCFMFEIDENLARQGRDKSDFERLRRFAFDQRGGK